MKTKVSSRLALVLALSGVGMSATAAQNQSKDAAVQQVLQKAQGAIRQLSQEKADLEAQLGKLNTEKAALEAEKKALQDQATGLQGTVKQLEPLKGEVERQKAAVEAMKNANTLLEAKVMEGAGREEELKAKMREIITQAKKIGADNHLLVAAVKEREQWISQCAQKNQDLFAKNEELIRLYQDKGFWDKVGDVEPFTGIGKVKTENTAQDFHFKLRDLQITPFESTLPPRKEPPPESNPPAEAQQDDGQQATSGDQPPAQ